MLHVLTRFHTEGDAAAKPAPGQGEAATDKPGQQTDTVVCLGDHCLLAVGTQHLAWDVP